MICPSARQTTFAFNCPVRISLALAYWFCLENSFKSTSFVFTCITSHLQFIIQTLYKITLKELPVILLEIGKPRGTFVLLKELFSLWGFPEEPLSLNLEEHITAEPF